MDYTNRRLMQLCVDREEAVSILISYEAPESRAQDLLGAFALQDALAMHWIANSLLLIKLQYKPITKYGIVVAAKIEDYWALIDAQDGQLKELPF